MSGVVGPKKPAPPSTHSALAGMGVLSGEAPAVQHTPGPWQWVDGHRLEPVWQDHKVQAVSSILDRDGGYGYVGRSNNETLAELEADFTLIAASPDLLDAARAAEAVLGKQKWLAGSTDPEAVALFKLRAAIAKATGSAA